ncbi:cytidylyltransferase domain-containing protein [uncultured Desulfobacter sp.]|uniref:cytidylyltransferase domain-containing protein n=1 Tax=uncultured Desulfobacter sp. TaxID=240139 RepID=UPI002AAC3A28|nr:hypothetical protein [uncultured Desulfobacter sp.]
MKTGILIQARLSSSRFPGKMLALLNGIPLIQFVFNRCKVSKHAGIVAVITSDQSSDDPLYECCRNNNIPVFRGGLDNVLDRYVKAAKFFGCDVVCRVCGDSPFVDICCIDQMFKCLKKNDEYFSVSGGLNGFISEIVTYQTLAKVNCLASSSEDREHVTKYIRDNLNQFRHRMFDIGSVPEALQRITLTVDYEKDMDLANLIVKNGLSGFDFQSQDVIKILHRIL